MQTLRVQYEALEKQLNQDVPELHNNDIPEKMVYIWDLYVDIRTGTNDTISYSAIKDYCDLFGYELAQVEISLVIKLDKIYWRVMNG